MSEFYKQYLKSAEWRALRARVLDRATQAHFGRPVCERCLAAFATDVHHKHYDTLGRERLTDLEALCRPCHQAADKQRAAKVRQRTSARRYSHALDTYATKKYGEDWDSGQYDVDMIEDEFDRWMERKRDEWY